MKLAALRSRMRCKLLCTYKHAKQFAPVQISGSVGVCAVCLGLLQFLAQLHGCTYTCLNANMYFGSRFALSSCTAANGRAPPSTHMHVHTNSSLYLRLDAGEMASTPVSNVFTLWRTAVFHKHMHTFACILARTLISSLANAHTLTHTHKCFFFTLPPLDLHNPTCVGSTSPWMTFRMEM